MPSRTSSSVGFGFSAEQVDGLHDHPRGAEAALEAVALAEGLLDRVQLALGRVSARPSMVVTVRPLACTASTLHDFTLVPSRCTVHAPQLEVSHPITVPVLPSFSRRYCTSSIRGSTSSETAPRRR